MGSLSLLADLRTGLRRLGRSPGFTAVALISLGLGIGANCALFTFVNAILLRPLPAVDAPASLVRVFATDAERTSFHQISFPNFRDLRSSGRGLDGLAGFVSLQASLGHGEDVRLERVELVSEEYFRVLGVGAAVGRLLAPGEGDVSREDAVVVLSHGLWQRRFGSDPDVVGEVLTVNGTDLTVIGVADPAFNGLWARVPPQAWMPLNLRNHLIRGPLGDLFDDRGSGIVAAVGRLPAGASREQAEAELRSVASELERLYPVANEGTTLAAVPAQEATIEPDARRKFALGAGLLMVVVSFVLLIACLNLAGLLLARSIERNTEIAIRLSLGAGRRQLVQMLLAEPLWLSLAGGGLGLLLAAWSRDALWALRPPELSDAFVVATDWRVLAFTLGLSLIAALVSGLAPALRGSRPDLVSGLKGTGTFGASPRGGSRARSILVAFQVGLSVVLVLGAILFLRSLTNAQELDPGFEVDDHLVLALDLGSLGYDAERGQQFYERAVERLAALPGVRSAAVAESLKLYPSALGYWLRPVIVPDREVSPDRQVELIQSNTVGEGYFRTLGLPVLQGRDFDARDRRGQPRVVVVNQTFAERFWSVESAPGRTILFQGESEPLRIIGVVGDAKYNSLGERPKPYLYIPLRQEYTAPAILHVRTAGDPAAVLPDVRRAIQELDPHLGLGLTMTMREVFTRGLWAPRAGATLFLVFGILAVGLAALGIYGTVSYSVRQRRREISVRLALGAGRRTLMASMLGQGLHLAAVGVGLGVVLALAASRLAHSFLFGLEGADLAAITAAGGFLLLVTLLANLLAAGKALGIQPQEALKET